MVATAGETQENVQSGSSEKMQDARLRETLKKLNLEHLLEPEHTDANIDPLDAIERSQKTLLAIHAAYHKMVTTLKSEPTMLMKLVNGWYQSNFHERVLWLALGAVPLAAIGAALGSPVLTAFALTNTVALTTAGTLADQHVMETTKTEEEFEKSLKNLSSFFIFEITALAHARKNLKEQITLLTQQNNSYEENLEVMKEELNRMRHDLTSIGASKELLDGQVTELTTILKQLKEAKDQDEKQIAQKQEELEKTSKEHQRCLDQIQKQQAEFIALDNRMKHKEARLNALNTSLSKTITVLSNNKITAADHEEFQRKLTEAVAENSATVAEGLKETSAKLQSVENELSEYKGIFAKLIEDINSSHFEQFDTQLKSPALTDLSGQRLTARLEQIGLFAPSKSQTTSAASASLSSVPAF